MKRVGHAIFLTMVACGPSRAPREDAGVVTKPARDPAAECVTLFDRAHAKLAPALAKLGIRETSTQARSRAQNVAGLVTCGQLSDLQRTCVLATGWTSCKLEPPFVLFDGSVPREALLGARLSPEDSARRVATLAGTWLRPSVGLDEAVQWKISAEGALAVKRTSRQGTRTISRDEPPHELVFVRDRQIAIRTGTSSQFVPAFADQDQIYLSWTSGALAIPIADDQAFVLDAGEHDRWVIRHGQDCELVDPRIGSTPLPCAFEDAGDTTQFVYLTDGVPRAWVKRAGVLIHPAMEVFTKQR